MSNLMDSLIFEDLVTAARDKLVSMIVSKKVSVDEAEDIWMNKREDFVKSVAEISRKRRTYGHKCFFCEKSYPLFSSERRIIVCDDCGVSLTHVFEECLMLHDIAPDDIREELRPFRKKLVEATLKYNMSIVAEAATYNYYRFKNYRKARALFKSDKVRMAFYEIFGKNLCLSDCMINLFIERAVDHNVSDEAIEEGVRILRKIGEKLVIRSPMVAAVFYLVSNKSQNEVSEIFGISGTTIRNIIRKYNLIQEFLSREQRDSEWTMRR
jgi:hypothetical protein